MRCRRAGMVAMATILLVTEVLSVSTGAREALTLKESPLTDLSTTTGYSNAKQNRALRVAQTPDQDDRAVDEDAKSEPNETEERAGGASSIVSKISDKIPMKLKMAWWRDFKKPASYVKKKMGLEGLSGAELTSHKNYMLFLKYKATIEKDWLDGMARGGFPTYDIWVSMGFERVSVERLKDIKNTEGFRIYKNYVKAFDENVESTIGSGYLMPKFVREKATPAELTARVEIWAETGKSASYVRKMLGMDSASGARAYAPYFEHFKQVAAALRAA